MHHHLQLRFFGKMTNFALLLQNVWFRLIVATTVAVAGLLALSSAMAILFIKPLELDLRDAKRGISRFERDLTRLKREVTAIEKKIDEKSKASEGRYEHYYTMYANPVRYINQFVLNQAKPPTMIVTSSSVVPNTSLTSMERTQLKPYIKDYGISRIQNLTKEFSVTRLSMAATGSFSDIGQYLSNLNQLPVKFSMRNFELRDNNQSLVLTLDLAFIVYRMEEKK
jgi:Tfp pilus assembly protein PilO